MLMTLAGVALLESMGKLTRKPEKNFTSERHSVSVY
jgi:hypothetical protein